MSRKLTRRERARKRQRWAKAMHSAVLEWMRAPLSGSDNVDWSSARERPISDSLSFLGPLTERCRPESFLDAIRSEPDDG